MIRRSSLFVIVVLALTGIISSLSSFNDRKSLAEQANAARPVAALPPGWGIDALLLGIGYETSLETWEPLLARANLKYLRERNPAADDSKSWVDGPIAADRAHRAAGYEVVSFTETPGVSPVNSWNVLPENLLQVYWSSYHLSRRLAGIVSVWELPNEPDTLYCRDLPDRLVAYCKAVYLGLKDGAAPSTPDSRLSTRPGVLMSALGNFPSPWLERAAENGLFDYTDGLNVHFYGHARDFRDALLAQRAFAARWVKDRRLPEWVTECGIDAVPHDRLGEPHGREIQREFVLETAQAALDEKVAVFMPFVLRWPDEPWFALTAGAEKPWPAWSAFAEFTRRQELPSQPVLAPPKSPGRVVLQWLPNNETCIPQKVSGSYWFRGSPTEPRPMAAQLVIYNFSNASVTGKLALTAGRGIAITSGGKKFMTRELTVPRFGVQEVSLEIHSTGPGYHKDSLAFTFIAAGQPPSHAVTWVETRPDRAILPDTREIEGRRPDPAGFQWLWSPEPLGAISAGGPWLCINGATVENGSPAKRGSLSEPVVFLTGEKSEDPRLPPMAITQVNGLPGGKDKFLRLSFADSPEGFLRVDLVDDQGQRFSVAENMGSNFFRHVENEVLMAYADFHIYAWGRCSVDPVFHPERIREIQLRFYGDGPGAALPVALDVIGP